MRARADTSLGLAHLASGRADAPASPSSLRVTRRRAPPALARWIDSFWEVEGSGPPSREHELPSGDVSLLFNLAGEHAWLDRQGAGPRSSFPDAWAVGMQEAFAVVEGAGGACHHRTFHAQVGLAPKTLARVHRLVAGLGRLADRVPPRLEHWRSTWATPIKRTSDASSGPWRA